MILPSREIEHVGLLRTERHAVCVELVGHTYQLRLIGLGVDLYQLSEVESAIDLAVRRIHHHAVLPSVLRRIAVVPLERTDTRRPHLQRVHLDEAAHVRLGGTRHDLSVGSHAGHVARLGQDRHQLVVLQIDTCDGVGARIAAGSVAADDEYVLVVVHAQIVGTHLSLGQSSILVGRRSVAADGAHRGRHGVVEMLVVRQRVLTLHHRDDAILSRETGSQHVKFGARLAAADHGRLALVEIDLDIGSLAESRPSQNDLLEILAVIRRNRRQRQRTLGVRPAVFARVATPNHGNRSEKCDKPQKFFRFVHG